MKKPALIVLAIVSMNLLIGCGNDSSTTDDAINEAENNQSHDVNILDIAANTYIPLQVFNAESIQTWHKINNIPGKLVSYGNGIYMAIKQPEAQAKEIPEVGSSVYLSSNGREWTKVATLSSAILRSMKFDGTWFYGVGHTRIGSKPIILRSKDGKNWQKLFEGNDGNNSLAHISYNQSSSNQGTYIASGVGGIILTSKDGTDWQEKKVNDIASFYSGTHFGNQFVLVGDVKAIYTSKDVREWQSVNNSVIGLREADSNKNALILKTNKYIYVYPKQANKWQIFKLPKNSLDDIVDVYNDNFIMTINNTVLQSADGVQWQKIANVDESNTTSDCNSSSCEVINNQIYIVN